MTHGTDFKILGIQIAPALERLDGRPTCQAQVRSYHDQLTYTFDDRYGSWLTTKADEAGRHKEPHPHVAAALQAARIRLLKQEPEPNPFMIPSPIVSIEIEGTFERTAKT